MKLKFSKKIVVTCIVVIIIYTAIQTYLSYKLGIELTPVLTGFVYGFFGTELAACAFIKIFEDKKSKENLATDTFPEYTEELPADVEENAYM